MKNLLLFAMLVSCAYAHSATYYFSVAQGDDARSFIEAQNPLTPWKSLSKLNAIFNQLQPGDAVLFNSGETFTGTLQISRSGTAALPIVLSAYGTGPRPVISGFATLTNWVAIGGGIYESYQAALGARVNMVTLNNTATPMGRFPNANAANKGYAIYESRNTNVSITDSKLNGTNWTGAEVVVRTSHWVIDRRKVASQSGGTLIFDAITTYWLKDKYGYFIQNDIRTLDQPGEWYYNPVTKKMNMFFGTANPGAYSVKAATGNTLVTVANQSHIVFDNLRFEGSNDFTFNISNAQHCIIRNSELSFGGMDAIHASSASNLIIENNQFTYNNNNGIFFGYNCSNNSIRNNSFKHTTTFPGMLKSGNITGMGIYVSGNSNLIEYNRLDSSGFTAIRFTGDHTIIRHNFISNFHFVKDDGGAIYAWNNNANATANTGRKIIGNIIVNGLGAPEGTEGNPSTDGIYMDDNSSAVEIAGNTISGCNNNGIYIHNSHNISITDNTSFNNNNSQVIYKYDEIAPNGVIRNMQLFNNIFFSKNATQAISKMQTFKDDIGLMGVADNNIYARPINTEAYIYNAYVNSNGAAIKESMELAKWTAQYGLDASSKTAPVSITPYKVNSPVGATKFPNGSFATSINGLYVYTTATNYSTTWNSGGKLDGGAFQGSISSSAPCAYSPIINVGALEAGKSYLLKFSSLATTDTEFRVYLRQANAPYATLTAVKTFTINKSRKENSFLFTMPVTETAGSIGFETFSQHVTFWLDNIELQEVIASETNPDDSLRFEYNATQVPKTIALDKNYIDARNNKYTGTLTLAPFTSVVLISDPALHIPQAPSVTFTSPLNGTTFSSGTTITLTAEAADADGSISKVEFYNGTQLIGTASAPPYTIKWPAVTAGTYFISARATDNSGLSTTSAIITLTVSEPLNAAPTVTLKSPVSGSSYTAPSSITITADATDTDGSIARVEFYNGSQLIGSAATSPYSFTWSNVAAGTYTITAKAIDNGGLAGTSASSSITVKAPVIETEETTAVTFAFINFSAVAATPAVNISWTATNATTTARFEIQRSGNNKGYKTIGTVPYTPRTENFIQYGFTDTKPSSTANYYRIMRIDLTGKVTYSDVVLVNLSTLRAATTNAEINEAQTNRITSSEPGFIASPVPAQGFITIHPYGLPLNADMTIRLYNTMGHLIKTMKASRGTTNLQIQLDNVKSGTYILQIDCGQGIILSKPFIKM